MKSIRNLAITLAAAALPLAAQTASQSNLVSVIPQAVDQRPQFGIALEAVDPILDGGRFGEVAADNGNFSELSQGLLRPLNIGIATQLSVLPIASPSSGVIFQEDPATGALLPSSDSLGPILTERAETIGKGRVYLGFTRQQFRFNNLEGANPTNFRALDPGGFDTLISQDGDPQNTSPTTVGMQVDLRIDQNVGLITYGVTNRFDVSAAFTVVSASASAVAFDALIHNTGDPFNGGTCWCGQTFDVDSSRATFGDDFGRSGFRIDGAYGSARRTSSGIGDTVLRAKGSILERPNATVAVGADLRLPTGDELDYHGSGAVGFKPFAAVSLHSKDLGGVRISPHFNVGYQFNGDSVLAGDALTGQKGSLPDTFSWSAGAAVSVSRRLTFVGDIVGNTLIDSPRLENRTITARGATASSVGVPDARGWTLSGQTQTFSMINSAFGFKLKVAPGLVLQSNVLIALENRGLRDKIVPLFGLGYSF